jgi:DNA-binding IclR family transcriptional regulator
VLLVGVVVGAIGVVGTVGQLLVPGTREELVRLVTEAARAVSRDLGVPDTAACS